LHPQTNQTHASPYHLKPEANENRIKTLTLVGQNKATTGYKNYTQTQHCNRNCLPSKRKTEAKPLKKKTAATANNLQTRTTTMLIPYN